MFSGLEIVALVGAALVALGGLGTLIAAFRTSFWWGLGVLLIWPVTFIFLVVHWQFAKRPFLLSLLGFGILLTAVYFDDEFDVSQPFGIELQEAVIVKKPQGIQKCITLQGKIIYGEVPPGVECSVMTNVKIKTLEEEKLEQTEQKGMPSTSPVK